MAKIFHFLLPVLLLVCSAIFCGNFAYVTNGGDGTVSKISTASNSVVGTITVGGGPNGIDLTPDAKFAYVANNTDGTVSVIDTASDMVVNTITVGAGPRGLAVSPDGSLVYVTNEIGDSISVIDTATNMVLTTIAAIGDGPIDVVFSPDGSVAYVTIINDGAVAFIDVATHMVTTTIPIGSDPLGIDVTPNGQFLYVGNQGDGEAGVLNTSTLATGLVILSNAPTGVVAGLEGSRVYVTQTGGVDVLSIIDVATNTLIVDVPVGNDPFSVALSASGDFAYVANRASADVSVVNLLTNTVIATIGVGAGPWDIAVVPETFTVNGAAKKDSFLTETNIFNRLTWAAPDNITALRYRIFRNGELIATVPAGQLSFEDNNLKRKHTYTYFIAAEGPGGSGAIGTVTVKTKS